MTISGTIFIANFIKMNMFRTAKSLFALVLLSTLSLYCCKSKEDQAITFSAHENTLQGAVIICDGNSIVWGAPVGNAVAYPALLSQDSFFKEGGVTFLNKGVGGQTWSDMLRDAETDIDGELKEGAKNVVVCFEGTNALYYKNITPQEAYTQAYNYVTGRRHAGALVIVATQPHAEPQKQPNPAGDSLAVYIEKTKQYNALLRQGWQTFADGFVDLEKLLPVYDTTYYQKDKVHLKPPGNKVLADAFSAALKQL